MFESHQKKIKPSFSMLSIVQSSLRNQIRGSEEEIAKCMSSSSPASEKWYEQKHEDDILESGQWNA